jgi:hypothetical protein
MVSPCAGSIMLWPDLIGTSWHATLSAQTAREPGEAHYLHEPISISTRKFADRSIAAEVRGLR